MSPTGFVQQSMQSLSAFWSARDARERRMLSVAVAVVASGLYYMLLIDPALNGREQLDKSLPELRQQVAQMQALSNEAAMFAKLSASPAPPMSRENIEAALAGKGLKAQNVVVSGDLAKVQLTAVSFVRTLEWLDEMQQTARLAVADANVVALDQPDTVDVTLTLRKL